MPSTPLELHPLCTLFPRVQGQEFDALVNDIKTNGLKSPIVLHDGMVLDGGNRYRACLEIGLNPDFIEFPGGSLVAFVLSSNLHRRHLSAGQQAAIVASAQDWQQAQGVGRPEQSGNVTGLNTVAARSAQSGASDKTQRMADKVARVDPELAKKVAHGEVSLNKAHRQVTPDSFPKPEAESSDELGEARDTIVALSEEIDQLRDRIAVDSMDASEDAKTEAAEIIAALREQVAALERDARSMRLSRDQFQAENAEMKKQIALLMRKVQKAGAGDVA